MKTNIVPRPLYEIAKEIREDWDNVYFGAVPYLDAMSQMNSAEENFGLDPGNSIVLYFLANAKGWRGSGGRRIKEELRRMIK